MNIKEIIAQEVDVRKISDTSTLTEEIFDERYEESQKENEKSSRVYLGELVYVVVRGKRINRARIFHYARTGRFRVEFVINGTQLASLSFCSGNQPKHEFSASLHQGDQTDEASNH